MVLAGCLRPDPTPKGRDALPGEVREPGGASGRPLCARLSLAGFTEEFAHCGVEFFNRALCDRLHDVYGKRAGS